MRLVEGNREHRPIRDDEPKPRPIAPDPPEWLSEGAVAIWYRMSPKLERLGVLTETDGEAFAALCHWYDKYVQAALDIAEEGSDVYTADSGYTQATASATNAMKYFDKALKLMQEFGLTPSSRTKIQVKLADDDDEMAGIID